MDGEWDSLVPFDVLAKLPANFFTQLESKKWQERQEPLQNLAALIEKQPRLDPKANYGEIISNLKNIIVKDSIVHVYVEAIKCMGLFARGLRKKFSQFVGMVLPVLLEKFKDKKPVVYNALVEAVDSVGSVSTVEDMAEDLVSAFGKPSPLIKQHTAHFMSRLIRHMTPQTLKGKLLKQLCEPLDKAIIDSDKDVREAAAAAIGAIMKVLGERPALMNLPSLANDTQKLAKIHEQRDLIVEECAREEAERAEALGNADGGDQAECNGSGPESSTAVADAAPAAEVDPWDLSVPVDILPKLDSNLEEQLESKKWLERKEPLDKLLALTEANIRLDGKANYGQLVQILKKTLSTDTNMQVVCVAAKCLAALASGVRKPFGKYAPMLMPVLLERYKDKKPAVVQAISQAVDACAHTTALESLLDDLVAALGKTSPNIRIQTGLFLWRHVRFMNAQSCNKKVMTQLKAPLIKAISDSDPEVRDAAAAAFGAMMNAAGQKAVLPLLADIASDNLKMNKITEYHGRAQQEGCGSEQVASMIASVHKANPAAASSASNAAPAASSKPPAKKTETSEAKKPVVRKAVVGAKKPTAAASNKPVVVKPKPKATVAPLGYQGPTISDQAEKPTEELDEEASALFDASTLTLWQSTKWDERLKAVQNMLQVVSALDTEPPVQAILHTVNKKKEVHFQVLSAKYSLYACIASKCVPSNQAFASIAPELLDKLGDAKQDRPVKDTLHALIEAMGMQYVTEKTLELAAGVKSPKAQSDYMLWLAEAIALFGVKGVPMRAVCELVNKQLAHTNPTVRTAAVTLAALLVQHVAATKQMIDAGNSASAQPLLAQYAKVEGVKPESPSRHVRGMAVSSGPGTNTEADAGNDNVVPDGDEEQQRMQMDEMVPRSDISGKLTESVMNKLEDANWKVRVEGLQELDRLVNAERNITNELGSLPQVLAKLMPESNRNVSQSAVTLCQSVSKACGPKLHCHLRVLVPAVLSLMADSKVPTRKEAVNTLNSFVEQCGLKAIFEGEMVADALKSDNPNLRAELFAWLSSAVPGSKRMPENEFKAAVPSLFRSIVDRNVDVRKCSADAVVAFVHVLGYDTLRKMLDRQVTDSNNKSTITSLLDKARAEQSASAPSISASSSSATLATAPKSRDSSAKPTARRSMAITKTATPSKADSKKKDEDFDMNALVHTDQKMQRFTDEKALKVLKWNFSAVDSEHVEQLKTQLAGVCKATLLAQLFHSDFKQHLKAIDTLIQCVQSCSEATIGASDLLLKWCTLRFFDTNPSVLLKSLDFLQALFALMAATNTELCDIEVQSFAPYLLLKLGEQKDVVRVGCRNILSTIYQLYAPSKVFPMLMDGIKTKNSRQKSECLDQMANLIEMYGLSVCGPTAAPIMKQVGALIGDRDKDVRNSALNCCLAVHMHVGDRVYKLCSTIGDKEKVMLDERIKRAGNRRVPTASASASGAGKAMPPSALVRPQTNPALADELSNGVDHGEPLAKRPSPKPKGMFQLDLDEVLPPLLPVVRIEPIKDMTEIVRLMREPIEYPVIRSRQATVHRANSLSSVSSMDASITLDSVISQVHSNTMPTCIQAVVQLDELVRDPTKLQLIAGKVDTVVTALYFQLRVIYNSHMHDEQSQRTDITRLYQSICSMLMSLLSSETLAREASEGPLKDLLDQLLTVLIDERLVQLPDGSQIVRSINVITVKLVEKSEPTAVLVALLRLFKESLQSATGNIKFQELVQKCIWKHCRRMPSVMTELQVAKILCEMHQFFVQFPMSWWKKQATDTPMRTMKTILNELVTQMGDRILDYVHGIDEPHNSELIAYIKKCLRDKPKQSLPGQTDEPPTEPAAPSDPEAEALADSVSAILRTVADKDNTKQGIRQLHEFQLANPSYSLQPFFDKSSSFFKSYVERQLQDLVRAEQLSQQRQQSAQAVASRYAMPQYPQAQAHSVHDDQHQPPITITHPDISRKFKELQEIRAKGGLAPSKNYSDLSGRSASGADADGAGMSNDNNNSLQHTDENDQALLDNQMAKRPKPSPHELNALRQRLEMVKRGVL